MMIYICEFSIYLKIFFDYDFITIYHFIRNEGIIKIA